MMFNPSSATFPPSIDPQPTDQFLGVGETLTISSHASGSVPLSYQWQKGDGVTFTDLPGESGDILSLPVTFAIAGAYRYRVSNAYGAITSGVANVTVGAVFSEVFKTALINATDFGLGGDVDAHYTLWSSSDIDHLGPDVIVMAEATPIGDYNPNDAGSMWVAPVLNPTAAVRGPYTYRTTFLVDSAETAGASLQGTILSAGPTSVLLNGQPTGFVNPATTFPGPHRLSFSFTLTNGFVAGLNTLDFVVDNADGLPNSQGYNALRVISLRGIGNALPEGLPTVSGPASQTVKEGGRVTFTPAPVARGRPPLTYQWLADGVPLLDATNRVLKFNPVLTGGQGSSFQVVIRNDSGSVTSAAATLTIVAANQPVTATNVNVTGVKGAPVRLAVSTLLQNANDPDGDLITLGTVDSTGTNTLSPAVIALEGASIVYSNDVSFVGSDRFNVTLSDANGGDATVVVGVQVTELRLGIGGGPGNSVRLAWPVSATLQGFVLRSADAVADPYTNTVSGTIVTEGSESALYVMPAAGACFYRLVQP